MNLFLFAAGAAEFSRKAIPLLVMPTASLIKLDSPLTSFTELRHVLFEEERSAYNQAISNDMNLSPAIRALQDRVNENEIQLALLVEEARNLEIEAAKAHESVPGSPHQVTHGSRSNTRGRDESFADNSISKFPKACALKRYKVLKKRGQMTLIIS